MRYRYAATFKAYIEKGVELGAYTHLLGLSLNVLGEDSKGRQN